MRHKPFAEFLTKKNRESLRQLGLLKELLTREGLHAESFLEEGEADQPYVFCHNPDEMGSFGGVRIYKLGEKIAFRVQTGVEIPIASTFSPS